MDVRELRRTQLRALINRKGGGVVSTFAKSYGLSESLLNRWLNPNTPHGKAMGEKAARNLEEKIGLPPGALDQSPGENSPNSQKDTEAPISHTPENNDAASLLLRLTGMLESLTQGGRGAAAELIAEAIKSPRLAPSNAALLAAMVSGNAPEAKPADAHRERTPGGRLLPEKKQYAEFDDPASHKDTGT